MNILVNVLLLEFIKTFHDNIKTAFEKDAIGKLKDYNNAFERDKHNEKEKLNEEIKKYSFIWLY